MNGHITISAAKFRRSYPTAIPYRNAGISTIPMPMKQEDFFPISLFTQNIKRPFFLCAMIKADGAAKKGGMVLGNMELLADALEFMECHIADEIRTEEAKHLLEGVVPQNIVTTLVYESAHEASIYQGAVMGEADIVEIRQRRV